MTTAPRCKAERHTCGSAGLKRHHGEQPDWTKTCDDLRGRVPHGRVLGAPTREERRRGRHTHDVGACAHRRNKCVTDTPDRTAWLGDPASVLRIIRRRVAEQTCAVGGGED